MEGVNRVLIFVLLLTLLYGLYTYQQHLQSYEQPKPVRKKKEVRFEDKYNTDQISVDNVSQFSLGSLEDLQSFDKNPYKQDSLLDSLDSKGSDDQSSLFFQ